MNPRERFAQYIRDSIEGNIINEGELYQASRMDTYRYSQGSKAFNRVSRRQKAGYSFGFSKGRAR